MGYRRDTTYRLKFADPEFHGLEVSVRAPSVGEVIDLTERAGELSGLMAGDLAALAGQAGRARLEAIFADFARYLVSWNLEDAQGRPVPPTLDGVLTQDAPFIFQIMKAWQEYVAGVPFPKGPSSNGGGQSPAASLPMEALSPSHGRSSTPS
ncbi:MAG: hypothetical protein L0Y54_23765 [Sporichthyaceae bacterium]|nr:hypothetical protein [Sporichthyaceae bacterium]